MVRGWGWSVGEKKLELGKKMKKGKKKGGNLHEKRGKRP